MLFGVDEAAGLPVNARGIKLTDFDAERLRLLSLGRDGVQPRIPAWEIHPVHGFPDGPVVIVRIHQSWATPHMVVFGNLSRFYMRSAGQRHQMDVAELRASFVGSEASIAKARSFRDDRIGKVLIGQTPVPLPARELGDGMR